MVRKSDWYVYEAGNGAQKTDLDIKHLQQFASTYLLVMGGKGENRRGGNNYAIWLGRLTWQRSGPSRIRRGLKRKQESTTTFSADGATIRQKEYDEHP